MGIGRGTGRGSPPSPPRGGDRVGSHDHLSISRERSELAEAVLAVFNRLTAQHYEAFTPAGRATSDLRVIRKFLADFPTHDREQCEQLITAILAKPWWPKSAEPVAPAMIFGRKVAQRNIARAKATTTPADDHYGRQLSEYMVAVRKRWEQRTGEAYPERKQ